MMRTLRLGIALIAVGVTLVCFGIGCGEKESPLDTSAPPPSANAKREAPNPNKRMPSAPPTTGGPGAGK